MRKWHELLSVEGRKVDSAVCILSDGMSGMSELIECSQKYFGDRCIVDPHDDSEGTRLLIANDVERMLQQRGIFDEWIPYELWTSTNARRWTEGLKKTLCERGYSYDESQLQILSCGQDWSGCGTKYSMLMSAYLGVIQTPHLSAELSPDAGFPFAAEFVERIVLSHHVQLYLFRTSCGQPMAQFLEGIRAIWEPPHVAIIENASSKVRPVVMPVNPSLMIRKDAVTATGYHLVIDVTDGCRPSSVTIFGENISFSEFRDLMAAARIEPGKKSSSANLGTAGWQDPITMTYAEALPRLGKNREDCHFDCWVPVESRSVGCPQSSRSERTG